KTLNAREIEYIKILNGSDASEYGVRGGHGVIEIKTSSMEYDPRETQLSKKFWFEGYLIPKTFIGLEGDAKSTGTNQSSHSKTTLYWNGELVTDNQGSNKVSFFTGDLVTEYLITIAGVSSQGEKIYKTV